MSKKTGDVSPWKTSQAKAILQRDIVACLVNVSMPADVVYSMHEEYHAYPYKNFKSNLKRLLEKVSRHRMAAIAGAEAHKNFLQGKNEQSATKLTKGPVWHKSDAERFLCFDIDTGAHERMKPKDLWKSREAYMQFSEQKFRNHLYSAIKGRKNRAYWENKSKRYKK